MRTIKFRAWGKGNKQMFYENFAVNPDGTTKTWGIYERLELMQYTGLKDKKGKEIYEGDIVKGNLYIGNDVCQVKWGNYSVSGGHDEQTDDDTTVYLYGWYFDWEDNETIAFEEDKCVECEVIGNIYENPELMEG